jgi:hypothetical protein
MTRMRFRPEGLTMPNADNSGSGLSFPRCAPSLPAPGMHPYMASLGPYRAIKERNMFNSTTARATSRHPTRGIAVKPLNDAALERLILG